MSLLKGLGLPIECMFKCLVATSSQVESEFLAHSLLRQAVIQRVQEEILSPWLEGAAEHLQTYYTSLNLNKKNRWKAVINVLNLFL